VLSSLPKTRPQRRSARRDAPKKAAGAEPPASAAKAKKPAAAAATAKKRPAARKKPTPAKPRVAAAPAPLPPSGFAPPRDTQDRPAPSGIELVGTAIQAAGELAQIGAAIGGQALKSALGRLGRS
jgi:hypothetical protein